MEALVMAAPPTDSPYKKGDVMTIRGDGHPWGVKEGPPRYVLVKCPGLTRADVRHAEQEWGHGLQLTVVQSNLAQDRFRIELVATNVNSIGNGGLTRAKAEALLVRMGATNLLAITAGIRFDIAIFDALTSPGFWRADLSAVSFSEDSYDQGTGVHRITADYSAASWNPLGVEKRIRSRGGVVTDHVMGSTVTFDADRADVRAYFDGIVTSRLEAHAYQMRRYHFAEADVDLALGQGGVVTVTQAQLQNRLLDRVAD